MLSEYTHNQINVKKIAAGLEKFWTDCAAVIIRQGIPEERVKWYVKWAQGFARSMSLPLRERKPGDVHSYADL